jgi:hypothetical protein
MEKESEVLIALTERHIQGIPGFSSWKTFRRDKNFEFCENHKKPEKKYSREMLQAESSNQQCFLET